MPRKSSFSPPGGTVDGWHTYAPSSGRSTVPLVPEAHATPPPTLSMPRRSAVVFEVSSVHCAWDEEVAVRIARRASFVRMRISVRYPCGVEQTLRAIEVRAFPSMRQMRRMDGAPGDKIRGQFGFGLAILGRRSECVWIGFRVLTEPSGAKAHIHLEVSFGTTKVVPCYKTRAGGFSASTKQVPTHGSRVSGSRPGAP